MTERRPGSRGNGWPEPSGGPFTLDEVWATYGPHIEMVARRRLDGDERRVREVAAQVMAEVARELAWWSSLPRPAEMTEWVLSLTRQACSGRLVPLDGSPGVPEGTGPPVPARVLMFFRYRAARHAADPADRHRDRSSNGAAPQWALAPVAAGLGRRIRSAASHVADLVRPSGERLAAAAGPGLPTLLGTAPGVMETAAALATAAILAVAGPAVVAPPRVPGAALHARSVSQVGALPPDDDAAAAADALEVRLDSGSIGAVRPTPPPAPPTPASPTAAAATDASPAPGATAAPTPPGPADTVAAAVPTPKSRVDPGPAKPGTPPVESTQYDDSFYYHTPHDPITLDVEGDGEDEASIGPPWVGIECERSDKRPPGFREGCPVIEEVVEPLPQGD